MVIIKWFFVVVFIFGCLPVVGLAAETPAGTSGTQESDTLVLASTKDELLLFWDEKDLYVQTATRIEKPLSHVAENMSIVTARDIEQMNAHTVDEVLNRVPGLFVDFTTMDFGSTAQLRTQGAEFRHVTVLLDGVVWNYLGGGQAITITIPVRTIERIEIVKGPASSAWGSALGGVINIITKKTGEIGRPQGEVTASYGEARSQDDSAEVYAKAGPVGYYLFAGRQESNGLQSNRGMQNNSLYAKLSAAPAQDLDLLFTIGSSDPDYDSMDIHIPGVFDLSIASRYSAFHATGSVNYRITPELNLKTAAYILRQKIDQAIYSLPAGALFTNTLDEDKTVAGSIILSYKSAMHRAVLGAETSHGVWDNTTTRGTISSINATIDKWALFANDTISFGKLAVTPGLRYDHNNISGSFVNPSLGATYELGRHTVARASVAKGFTTPPLAYTRSGHFNFIPNPALTAEKVISYQAGFQSGIVDLLNVKATLFRHDMTNEMLPESYPDYTFTYKNKGDVSRQGYELETETVPFYNVSLKASHAYVYKKADSQPESKDIYSFLLGIKYDDRQFLLAQLAGTYVWWGDANSLNQPKYDNFVWDLNLSKKFRTTEKTNLETFMTVHNLFNASYYTVWIYPNPERWVEAGLRFKF